jgi:hypothetical protein
MKLKALVEKLTAAGYKSRIELVGKQQTLCLIAQKPDDIGYDIVLFHIAGGSIRQDAKSVDAEIEKCDREHQTLIDHRNRLESDPVYRAENVARIRARMATEKDADNAAA